MPAEISRLYNSLPVGPITWFPNGAQLIKFSHQGAASSLSCAFTRYCMNTERGPTPAGGSSGSVVVQSGQLIKLGNTPALGVGLAFTFLKVIRDQPDTGAVTRE